MPTNQRYFNIDDTTRDYIERKPNLTLDIPKTGYNFKATNYICSKIAEQTDKCGFLDTARLINAKDLDSAQDIIIDACMYEKTLIGEIPVDPKNNQYLLLNSILQISEQTLTNAEYENRRMVAPLTINSNEKEPHGVALCIDVNKKDNLANIIILEQHAQTNGGKLDYSEEINMILSGLQRVFEERGTTVNTFRNEKPICREKGVCGIVSAEVCKRLLQAEDPMKTAKLGIIKINAEKVQQLHKNNFLHYQNDNAASYKKINNNTFIK